MTEIKFYRGLAEKYDQELHGDGLYFATNTLQIIHNGQSYGISNQVDLSDYATKDFVSDSLCNFIYNLKFNSKTGVFSYERKETVYVPIENEFGETIYESQIVQKDVTFSLRPLLTGMVKGINFRHTSEGKGQIIYSQLTEKSEILDTGEEKITLEDVSTEIDIPDATYEDGYKSGLMSGGDKESLDLVKDTLQWKSPNI